MNSHFYYLLIDLGVILFPFLFSFRKEMTFAHRWKDLLRGMLLMMALYIPWDMVFTHFDIWHFNPRYILGIPIGNLPLEEWLFFICIPYSCVFTYECMKYFFPKQPFASISQLLSIIFIVVCVVFLIFFYDHAYTAMTAVVTIILLFYHSFIRKTEWMGYLFFSWMLLLIPFYLSNGLLTGLNFWDYPLINTQPELITDQIVWYNNEHNLGVRIWTVPLDDFFYGFAMLLLTLTGYEYRNSTKKQRLA